ncbi:MAG: hypothetical protein QXG76_00825 [Candidatus Bathyarchaeia archaeon]
MCPKPKKERTIKKSEDKLYELTTTQHLVETIKQLQTEIEDLKAELKKVKSIPTGKIGLAFIILGVLAFIFAMSYDSNILAFIGLGLTFWGALFFFIRPAKYAQSSLLDSTAVSTYTTTDRIIKDLKFKGKSYYIPPYPKEVYLPEYLKGLKEPVVFISADTGGMPSIEELAKSKFLLANPKGICIVPPGLGLLTKFENELRKDMAKFPLNELCEILPSIITENLQLAKEMEIKVEDRGVYLKMLDAVYMNLYSAERNLISIHRLGCPIISAIACALSKAAGKIVTIQRDNVSPDGQTIEVWYRFMEA